MTVDPDELPMATHTRVLGVDITDHQQANWNDVHEGGHPGGLGGTKVEAVGSDKRYIGRSDRRYIAAWARRTLFRESPATGGDDAE